MPNSKPLRPPLFFWGGAALLDCSQPTRLEWIPIKVGQISPFKRVLTQFKLQQRAKNWEGGGGVIYLHVFVDVASHWI